MNICSICGDCIDNDLPHNYRHEKKVIKIPIENIDGKEYYVLNANQYPESKKKTCNVPQCGFAEELHETDLVEHKFDEVVTIYKELKFTLPLKARCIVCSIPFDSHSEEKHRYKMPIKYIKSTIDKISIANPLDKYSDVDLTYLIE